MLESRTAWNQISIMRIDFGRKSGILSMAQIMAYCLRLLHRGLLVNKVVRLLSCPAWFTCARNCSLQIPAKVGGNCSSSG